MRRYFLLAVLTIPLALTPGWTQYPSGGSGEDYNNLLESWARRYLHRSGDANASAPWVQALQTGTREEEVLSWILGSDEYYGRAGSDDRRFIQMMYRDVTGRSPTPQQMSYWLNRLYQDQDRKQLSYEFLLRHPEGLDPTPPRSAVAPPPPVPEYHYRRPGYGRYDPDYRRDWHDRRDWDRDRRDRDRRDRR